MADRGGRWFVFLKGESRWVKPPYFARGARMAAKTAPAWKAMISLIAVVTPPPHLDLEPNPAHLGAKQLSGETR